MRQSFFDADLVVSDLPIDFVGRCQRPEVEAGCRLDEVRLVGVGLCAISTRSLANKEEAHIRVAKGRDDDRRNVDEVAVDIEDVGNGVELRLDTMTGRAKGHERLCEAKDELVPKEDV